MSEWRDVTVAELGKLYDGPHATPTRITSGPYFLNISSLEDGRLDLSKSDHVSEAEFVKWTRRITPAPGDLLFSYETRLGEAALMPSGVRACLGRRMALIRPDRSIVEPRYLLYLYLSPVLQSLIEKNTIHGATVNRIALSTMSSWQVSVPPLHEQRAIAEVLGALDDKIAANTKLAEASEHFVAAQFDLAMRGSTTKPLLDVVSVHFGEAFKGAHFVGANEGRPLIRIRDLRTFSPQIWTTEKRTRELLIEPGEILVGMDAEFRPTAWLGVPGLLNQRVCRMHSELFGPAYLREALRRPLTALENEKSATTVIHLNKSDLERATIEVPTQVALDRFERNAEPVFAHRVALASQSRALAATRDALLPQLMSGKLRVKDAESLVAEVA